MVSKWLKNGKQKSLLKQRPARKYLPLYNTLLRTFKEAQSNGHHVNFNWLWSRARQIYRQQQADENIIVKKHVIVPFLRRFNIRMRCRQSNKKEPK